jgi:hypothetical protein
MKEMDDNDKKNWMIILKKSSGCRKKDQGWVYIHPSIHPSIDG